MTSIIKRSTVCTPWVLMLVVCLLSCPLHAEDVLVVRPADENFTTASEGILSELDNELTLAEFIVDADTSEEKFLAALVKKPKVVVLMEGRAISLYTGWQKSQPEGTAFPVALVMMTAYVEERIHEIKNAFAIKYEIQAVQSISLLRSALAQPVRRVGVLYSTNLRLFFANQQENCRKENIELVGTLIDEKSRKLEKVISTELKKLVEDPTIDAIWIFNDNIILKDMLLEWAWVPRLKKSPKPVVVSLERLVFPLKLGHFAVVPDHTELGVQAARLILDLQEGASQITETVRKPYSAHKKYNAAILPKEVKLNTAVIQEEWTDLSGKK